MGETRFLNLSSDNNLVRAIQRKEQQLNNPLSEAEIRNNLERLDSIMIPIIKRTEIGKNHDPYQHGLELIEKSQKIAKLLGCSGEETLLIGLAAYLHDIGKREVYDSIVNKPSQLTEEEYKEIKKHVIFGGEIVKPFTYMGSLINSHHERWDGRGYMGGLKGNAIPLGSRIISVVDAYDAMTHKRIYDAAQPKEFAINEIQRCSKIEFDVGYVKNFRLNVLKNLSCNCSTEDYKQKLLEVLCKKGEFIHEEACKKELEKVEKDYMHTRLRFEEQFDKSVVVAFLAVRGIKNKRYMPKIKRFGYIEVT